MSKRYYVLIVLFITSFVGYTALPQSSRQEVVKKEQIGCRQIRAASSRKIGQAKLVCIKAEIN